MFCFFFIVPSSSYAYYFGFVSSDWTLNDILQLEEKYQIQLPLLGYILDSPELSPQLEHLENIALTLGTGRVYTITFSPHNKTATAVANGEYDDEYLLLFSKIRELGMKVVFRTMHEMNGGRYPRSSNPSEFKRAWQHVWELSRGIELDQKTLLFDFSVNHRDMPTKGFPNQNAILFQCNQNNHPNRSNCPTFEDYYPGDQYVDVVGVSFYNWGKANSNRLRLSPGQILYDSSWNTLERLKKFHKPLLIDEVGTSSIWYPGAYSPQKTSNFYAQGDTTKKEERLVDLKDFLVDHPEIWGVSYFNIDYTNGYQYNAFGEGDWAIVNFAHDRVYHGFFALIDHSNLDFIQLFSLFTPLSSSFTEDIFATENSDFGSDILETEGGFYGFDEFDQIDFSGDDGDIQNNMGYENLNFSQNKNITRTMDLFENLIDNITQDHHEKVQLYKDLSRISFDDVTIDQSIQYLTQKYQ